MRISNVAAVTFKQQNPASNDVREPRTYIIRNSAVTLTAEEETLYRKSLRQTWKSILSGALIGGTLTGVTAGIMSRGKKLPTAGVIALLGGLAGAAGGIIEAIITGKSRYTRLPYDKVTFENGLARHNLATMNVKE